MKCYRNVQSYPYWNKCIEWPIFQSVSLYDQPYSNNRPFRDKYTKLPQITLNITRSKACFTSMLESQISLRFAPWTAVPELQKCTETYDPKMIWNTTRWKVPVLGSCMGRALGPSPVQPMAHGPGRVTTNGLTLGRDGLFLSMGRVWAEFGWSWVGPGPNRVMGKMMNSIKIKRC